MLRMEAKRSSTRKVLAMENEWSDTERSDPEGAAPEANDAGTERSEPVMEKSTQSSVPTILKRPRVLALLAALVVLIIVLITACGGGDDTGDAGADTGGVDLIDTGEDLLPPEEPPVEPIEPEAPVEPAIDPAELPITKVKGKALKRGMQNKRVQTLQEALVYLGYLAPDSADGQFGPKTKKAVQEFQLEMGLNGDGVAGQKTIRAINKAVKAAPAGGSAEEPADGTDAGTDEGADAGTDDGDSAGEGDGTGGGDGTGDGDGTGGGDG